MLLQIGFRSEDPTPALHRGLRSSWIAMSRVLHLHRCVRAERRVALRDIARRRVEWCRLERADQRDGRLGAKMAEEAAALALVAVWDEGAARFLVARVEWAEAGEVSGEQAQKRRG